MTQNNLVILAALLLKAGAATEARDYYGCTALITAAVLGHTSMVAALLASGAVLEAEMEDGSRALHYAADYGHTSTVEASLQRALRWRLRARKDRGHLILLPSMAILRP